MGKNTQKRFFTGKILFIILILLMMTSTVLLNIFAVKFEKRFDLVGDLTANTAYKVGDETKAVLNQLTKDIEIFVLADESEFVGDSYLEQANRMIKEYDKNSAQIALSYVDYTLDPTFASKYPDLTLTKGDILITSGDNTEQISLADMFNYEQTADGNLTIASSRAEEVLTGAIVNAISEKRIRVAMLQGSGAVSMDAFTSLLDKNGFVLDQVSLATGSLDQSYDIAVLLAPQQDLSETALETLERFLYNGGEYGKMLIYTADVAQEALPLMEAYLKEWGVSIGDGAVFETKADRTFQSQPFYPIADYSDADLKNALIDASAPVLMPLSRPMATMFDVRDNQYTQELLTFAETAGVRPSDAEDFSISDTEIWGPMSALVLASRKIISKDGSEVKQSDILISASTEMLADYCIDNTSLANSEYLVKFINQKFGKEDTVAIVPKSLSGNPLTMTTRQKNIIGIAIAIIIPFFLLAAGIAIFIVRRHK